MRKVTRYRVGNRYAKSGDKQVAARVYRKLVKEGKLRRTKENYLKVLGTVVKNR